MTLFADPQLVARIERAEAGLLRDAVAHGARRSASASAYLRDVAGGVAACTEPGSPLNKLCGLGFGDALDPGVLAEIEREFAARGESVRVEVASLAEPGLAETLTARGYRLLGFENVLGMSLPVGSSPKSPAAAALRVALDADLEVWLDALVGGFCDPDPSGVGPAEPFEPHLLRRIVGDFARTPGMVRLLASHDGQPVGGASLRITEGVAQLCGAATLPPFRRRGVQSALLAERLTMASAAGCDVAVLTAQPGSGSMRNAQRRGFALLYVRAILGKAVQVDWAAGGSDA